MGYIEMTDEESVVKPTAVLLCDDIRKEDNGKQILIGVYSGSLLVKEFPASLLLFFWVLFETKIKGELKINIRVKVGGVEMIRGELSVEIIEADEPSSIPIGRFPVNIRKESDIELEWQINDLPWETIHRKRVRLTPSAEPNPS